MSQFPLPVNLALELQEFIAKLAEAKSLYKSFKGEVEGDPVRLGGGGGGVVQGNGTRPPMVMQPPKFDYQGGPHSTVQMNPTLMAAARGAVNSGNTPAINAIASNMGVTPDQIIQSVSGKHSTPTAGVIASNVAIQKASDPSGFSTNMENPNAIGPGMANGRFTTDPSGGGSGSGGFATTLARRAVAGFIIYGIARELENVSNWERAAALAGGSSAGQAAATSAFAKAFAPGLGGFYTQSIDIQLGRTDLQNSYQSENYARGAANGLTRFGNYGLAQGSRSLSRSLAGIEFGRRQRASGLVGGGVPANQLEDEGDNHYTPWIFGIGDAASREDNRYDEGAYERNRATEKRYRDQTTAEKKLSDDQAKAEARNATNDFIYETARIDINANAQKLANNFRPRAGAAMGILGNFGVDADAYGAIQNPTNEDRGRLTAQANSAISQLGSIQHDINQNILGGRPTRISAYESPLEYKDASNENLNDASGSVKQSLDQIYRLLEQKIGHHN